MLTAITSIKDLCNSMFVTKSSNVDKVKVPSLSSESDKKKASTTGSVPTVLSIAFHD